MKNNTIISFKKLSNADLPIFTNWFSNSHVRSWWPVPQKDELLEHFLKRIRSKNTFGYIVNPNDKPIGYIQYYYIDPQGEKTGKGLPKLPPNTIGTDQFIGEAQYIGKGIGTLMLKKFIQFLQEIEPKTKTIIVDPDPANLVAIRCYEKVGFNKIGTYQMSYGPCLLMQYDIHDK